MRQRKFNGTLKQMQWAMKYFAEHKSELVLQYELDEWLKGHPECPVRSATNMKGIRTRLRNQGILE